MTNEHARELAKLKQKLCFLEEKIDWKRQEIAKMQEEVEQLYKGLKQCEGEAA